MEIKQKLAGNENTSLLKLLALVFMCFDHFGKMLFPQVPEMRMIGRLAFPVYAWCLVVGACHTRNIWKYALRILGVGLISQPIYMAALHHTWREPNIFLTLLLGLLAIAALRERKFLSQLWGPVAALALAQALGCDYGWRGVLLMVLLYAARKDRGALGGVIVAFCLFWGSTSSQITQVFGWQLPFYGWPGIGPILSVFLRLQGLAVLALPLIVCSMPWRIRMNRWVGYALYPAHLLILWLCQLI